MPPALGAFRGCARCHDGLPSCIRLLTHTRLVRPSSSAAAASFALALHRVAANDVAFRRIPSRASGSHAEAICSCPDTVASPLLRIWQQRLGKFEMQQNMPQNSTESFRRCHTCFAHRKAAANTTMPVTQDTQRVELASGSRRAQEDHLHSTASARPGTSPGAMFAGLAPLTCLEAFACAI